MRRAVRAVVPDRTVGRRGPVVARRRREGGGAEDDALRVRRVAVLGERQRGRAPVLADVVGHLDGVGAVRFCSDGVRVGAPGRGNRHRSVAHARRPAIRAAARLDDSPMKHVRELRRRLDFQIMAHARHGADAATYVIQSERQRIRLVDTPGTELERRERLSHRVGRAPQFVRRGAVRIRGRGDQGIISEGQGPETIDGRAHDHVAVLGPLIRLEHDDVLVRFARARRFRDVNNIRTAARPARRAGVGAPAGHGRDRRSFTLARRDAVELLYTIIVRGLADPARAALAAQGLEELVQRHDAAVRGGARRRR